VTQLARNLNIQVVAEGVETMDQALILQSLDCEFGQGYLFSKPMTADQVPQFKVQAGTWPSQDAAVLVIPANSGRCPNPHLLHADSEGR